MILLIPILLPVGYIIVSRRNEEDNYFERFGVIKLPQPPEQSIWFHCASVGETRSLKNVICHLKKNNPDIKILISTMTSTGRKVAEDELQPYAAFLLPFENSLAIKHIIGLMNVKALFIVDTELWPNLIMAASKKTKLFLINGRISEKSFKSYKKLSFIFGPLLAKFNKIYTKSEADTEKFISIRGGNGNVQTMGNMKFFERKSEIDISEIEFLKDSNIFVAASTHRGEDEICLKAYKESESFDKMILAPRHMFRVKEACEKVKEEGFSCCLLSDYDEKCDVVVVDSFGKLEMLFSIASKVFIGGSIVDIGGHNIFESLQFNVKTAVGSNMYNFQEIYDIGKENNVVVTVEGKDDLLEFMSSDDVGADFDGFFSDLEKAGGEKLDKLNKVINGVLDV